MYLSKIVKNLIFISVWKNVIHMTENFDKNKPSGMRNVYAMGLVIFFTDFSTEMILGILPFFIVAGLGASRASLEL